MSLPVPTQPGDLLGKYRVMEHIGGGGMAEVFHGRHEKLDRDVAIKVLHTRLAADPGFIARFEREARLVANLRHTNIIQVFDFDAQGDSLYMVMEYIKGGTLKDYLELKHKKGEHLSLVEIQGLFTQIADALDHAHEQGMLHRDLKPSNILMDHNRNTYLSDFGIARIIGQSEITRTGSILGTPAYMSPEQCEGKPLTESSDLYSLGVILYEMITGNIPFDADSPLAVIHKHIHDPLPPISDYRQDLPAGMDVFIEKALAKSPADRFPSARALLDAYSRLIPDDPASTQLSVETVKITEDVPQKNGKERNPLSGGWLTAGIILIILLGLTAALILYSRQSNLAAAKRCTTPKTCEAAAIQLLEANRPLLALEAYNKAATLVTPADQPEWAQLKCDQADLLVQLNKIADARLAFRDCIVWSQNDPELSTLRTYAQDRLKNLR